MNLVKIDDDLYLNPEFISSIEPNSDRSSIITMNNEDVFSPNIPIKKVLNTICSVNEEQHEKSTHCGGITIIDCLPPKETAVLKGIFEDKFSEENHK